MTFKFTQTLGYALVHTAILLRTEVAARFQRAGYHVTAEEWAVLALLHEKRDGIAQNQLAELTIKDKTTVVRLLDRLSDKGLVERRVSPSDRRVRNVFLTDAGLQLADSLVAIAAELLGELSAGIGREERGATLRGLHLLADRLKSIQTGQTPATRTRR